MKTLPQLTRSPLLIALSLIGLVIPGAAEAGEHRGAIEIGAKGVKATVVDVGDKPGEPSAKVLMTQVVNTTITAGVATSKVYNADAIRETAEAAGGIAKRMRDEFQVADGKIRVFGSSGLPRATNSDELVEAVKAATGLPSMEFITPAREVELTIKGLLSPEKQATSLLIDVGSGNTKGGLIGANGSLSTFSIPQGSVTFADRTTKAAAGKPFAQAADAQRPGLLEAPMAEQVKANPGFTARSVVYLNGGAPYALTTLIHPEAARQEEVTLSAADIAKYLQTLTNGAGVPAPDFAAIADPKVKAAAEKEFANVRDNFTRDNLIAGAEILTALSNVFQFEGKTIAFNRTGLTALVRAPVEPPAAPVVVVETPVAPKPAEPAPAPTPAPTPPPAPAPAPAPTPAPAPAPTPAPGELSDKAPATPASASAAVKTPPVPSKTLPVAVPPGS